MLTNALIYLFAAVISVPIAKRLGLGSVLGYLLAGVLIGPYVLHLVGNQTDTMHFAEFGVVMMLFLIGLELRPARLWELRRPILGLGGLQVGLTALAIIGVLLLVTDLPPATAIAISLAVALSSTAIVLQSLSERGLMKTQAGSNAFSVLLFQDIAVIPILALLPLLAVSGVEAHSSSHHASLLDGQPTWIKIAVTLGTICSIIAGGRLLANPVFRFIAETRLRDIFTAFALLIVVAITVLMQAIGLSPALGSFVAGVVLAESEFRHELEVNIEPFKGLLLGLFFITVGASINFEFILSNPLVVITGLVLLVAVKFAVLALLAKIFNLGAQQGLLFALALAQGGEFAFVIVSSGTPLGVFSGNTGDMIIAVVALSMLISPLFIVAYENFFGRRSQPCDGAANTLEAEPIEPSKQVIIAGYGRFGQVVGRLLSSQGFQLTILDHSPSQIDLVRRFGNKVFYGDASRRDLLEAAGADEAQLLVIAVDEPDKTTEIIEVAQKHFPHLKLIARATDRRHAYELKCHNVAYRRETFDSALHLGVDALQFLGFSTQRAEKAGTLFAEYDEQSIDMLADKWGDDKTYGAAMRQRLEDLNHVLQTDALQSLDEEPSALGNEPSALEDEPSALEDKP
ncbi:MAG: monovalent cation:proton antiporter-2 (CPA2) family protein [bacterium]